MFPIHQKARGICSTLQSQTAETFDCQEIYLSSIESSSKEEQDENSLFIQNNTNTENDSTTRKNVVNNELE